ncbi:MAG: ribosome biogenesis GTPase Der [Gemmatimonadetes bacterium]|uniref:GTPase Der n=1 Tax=Candidatus Kutchimonas denitrificans TaxID=3056748 RepID=A0AAE4Z7L7_9BACT|nr:ribosome biogenesis GTPase Der [Gemmatimonadota bacterium]NIR75264.1 ribosome biogenesis GTPase Der [Candidatus Kutchimonas denitrificans]NIS00202.1 ribosome biogenesis GTPase Der [Gemmatimonadota bacterium]NIT65794.1 ribosome biogenesis GTPase Der [Gemmatimonadota bacterium]NIU53072.1 ribosome biogenesis GTPase Der [Gemmatimonadota bacterium]
MTASESRSRTPAAQPAGEVETRQVPTGPPTVAIVGRPNVGKSTFFNRVVGGRPAIVDRQPGVTRDVHFGEGEWGGRRFYVVDTGGILEDAAGELDEAIRRQALLALEEASVIVFMVDGREGIHPLDEHIAELLRVHEKRTILAVNKIDDLPESSAHLEFYALGLGDPHPLAAASGRGSGDLLDAIVEMLPAEARGEREGVGLRLAVIGRPNVGKSSFINRVLGSERLVVSEEAGTTRDAIDTPFEREGRRFVFVDTAGLRRKSRVTEGLEYYATLRTMRAIDRADVCTVIVDADDGVSNQDFRIVRHAWDRGCGVVLAVNKWDLVEKDTHTAVRMEKALHERVPFLANVPTVFISALTGQRVQRALDLAWQVGAERKKRIPTPALNERLQQLTQATQPPQKRGTPLKFLYASQVGTEPPTFAIWCSHPRDVPESYVRYLRNGFRDSWGFQGVPIRIRLRSRRKKKRKKR